MEEQIKTDWLDVKLIKNVPVELIISTKKVIT